MRFNKLQSNSPPAPLYSRNATPFLRLINFSCNFVAMQAVIGSSVKVARKFLEEGRLVAIPTETVYGLGGNALNAEAVAAIFDVKDRPRFDPLIVHIPTLERAKDIVQEIPAAAYALATRFWPGPLTLLLPKNEVLPDLVTAGLNRVGLRCPDHPLTRELLHELSFPLAAPSANPFGYVSPTTAQHVFDQLGMKIPYILDGGSCRVGIESTIVGWEDASPVVYRLGGLGIEDIESVVGKVRVESYSSSQPQAPGQLQSHYAPAKPFFLGNIEELIRKYNLINPGILTFQDTAVPFRDNHLILSPTGSLHEAARNLFGMLREFDHRNIDAVVAEGVPDEGLGRAINDRLKRAAAQRP